MSSLRHTAPPRTRLPVRRIDSGLVAALGAEARARLGAACYELWHEFFDGLSEEQFVETHLTADTWLVTAWGDGDRLAGYYNLCVLPIDIDGRRVYVLTSGLFTRPEYDAAPRLIRRGFLHCVRARLRHPGAIMAYVPVATTPVAYRAVARALHRYYPRRGEGAPSYVRHALAEMCRVRGFRQDPERPYVVDFFARQRKVDDLMRSEAMSRSDEAIHAYTELVPDWAEGKALLVWIPGDLVNVFRTAINLALRRGYRGRPGAKAAAMTGRN
jgi:hypothetical protein